MVFENRVLRRIFGPKRDEVTREWKKLHNDLYYSPSIVRVIRMGCDGHVARMEDRRDVYYFLVGKHAVKCTLGRPRRRWEDNIKMDLKEVGCGGIDWIELSQGKDRWQTL